MLWKRTCRTVIGLLVLVVPLAATGCEPIWAVTNTVFLAAGWIANGLAVNASPGITCYRNGVLIDCADVPAELQPVP